MILKVVKYIFLLLFVALFFLYIFVASNIIWSYTDFLFKLILLRNLVGSKLFWMHVVVGYIKRCDLRVVNDLVLFGIVFMILLLLCLCITVYQLGSFVLRGGYLLAFFFSTLNKRLGKDGSDYVAPTLSACSLELHITIVASFAERLI